MIIIFEDKKEHDNFVCSNNDYIGINAYLKSPKINADRVLDILVLNNAKKVIDKK